MIAERGSVGPGLRMSCGARPLIVATVEPTAFVVFVTFMVLIACLLGAGAARAQQPVQVPSLDRERGAAVMLPGTWFAAAARGPGAAEGRRPAMLLMHGCGGLFDRQGGLADRYTELAAQLNAMGIHVLVTDSLTPRGEKELCTQRTGQRQVTQLNRRRDALGALAWLAAQPGVDPARLGLLGWSNGGSTVLSSTNLEHDEVARSAVRPSLAVAFYPGCEAELKRGYRPAAPLLMLLGEADDWTAAAPCKALAAGAAAAAVAVAAPSPVSASAS